MHDKNIHNQETPMKRLMLPVLLAGSALLTACTTTPTTQTGKPEYMVVGIDNKVLWDDSGKLQLLPPGKDAVTIVDIGTDPANPKIVVNLPLMNSVFGPPTNLAITPDGSWPWSPTRWTGRPTARGGSRCRTASST
jgi:hypothetical protein